MAILGIIFSMEYVSMGTCLWCMRNDGPLVYAGVIHGREDDAPEYHGYFVTYL